MGEKTLAKTPCTGGQSMVYSVDAWNYFNTPISHAHVASLNPFFLIEEKTSGLLIHMTLY